MKGMLRILMITGLWYWKGKISQFYILFLLKGEENSNIFKTSKFTNRYANALFPGWRDCNE